jgi:hypothetical protein
MVSKRSASMKYVPRALSLAIVLSLILAACSAGDVPENGAKEWLTALASGESAKVVDRTCTDQAALKSAEMWKVAFGAALGAAPDKVDISDIKFATKNTLGSNAYVRVTGKLRTGTQTQDVDQLWMMQQEASKWKWCGQ